MQHYPRRLGLRQLIALALVSGLLVLGTQMVATPSASAHADSHETHRHWQESHGHWHRWVYYGHTWSGCFNSIRTEFLLEQHGSWWYGGCHVHA